MNKLILMRHAEKDSTGQITKKGIEDAFQLGKKLKSKGIEIELIRTSPIERCKKTALELINGYNEEICTIEDNYLGDPGIYIKNDKSAIKVFNEYQLIEVMNKQIKNEYLEGFEDFIIGSKKLERKILNEKYASGKIIVYISHDAIINPFIAYLNKSNAIHSNEIVNYLEYFEIIKYDNLLKYVEPKKSFF